LNFVLTKNLKIESSFFEFLFQKFSIFLKIPI
jgi:hypothetical protein